MKGFDLINTMRQPTVKQAFVCVCVCVYVFNKQESLLKERRSI